MASFSFVASGSGNSPTITIPGTIAAGDVCLIFNFCCRDGAQVSDTVPSGFTNLRDAVQGSDGVTADAPSGRGIVSVKTLTGAETTVTGMSGFASFDLWIALVLRPDIAFTLQTDNDTGNNAITLGSTTAQTIHGTSGSMPTILYGQMTSAAAVVSPSAPGMTQIAGATTSQVAYYDIINPGGSLIDVTFGNSCTSNRNVIQSGYLTFTFPAVAPPPYNHPWQQLAPILAQ